MGSFHVDGELSAKIEHLESIMNQLILAFLGWPEIVMILVVVMLLFGAKKLPELARGLGSGIKEFKKASKEDSSAE